MDLQTCWDILIFLWMKMFWSYLLSRTRSAKWYTTFWIETTKWNVEYQLFQLLGSKQRQLSMIKYWIPSKHNELPLGKIRRTVTENFIQQPFWWPEDSIREVPQVLETVSIYNILLRDWIHITQLYNFVFSECIRIVVEYPTILMLLLALLPQICGALANQVFLVANLRGSLSLLTNSYVSLLILIMDSH